MLTIRRSRERGHANHGWLDTYHTFSFAQYYDPKHMGFRALRVINEDTVAPGRGFGTHPHNDMEIVTVVMDGAIEHRDSMGNGEVLRPGEVQRMTAGTGITHSEFNPSSNEPLHLLQIWLLPDARGLTPSYEQKAFPREDGTDGFKLVVSPDGRDGSLSIHQDAAIYRATLAPGETVEHDLASGRHAWVQVMRGRVSVNGTPLEAGDGAALSDEAKVVLEAQEDTELLLFDLA